MSGYKLHWFRISPMCNSTTSENEPCGKLTGGSYWFSCLPLINLYWCTNIIGMKYGSTVNLGLVLNDRLNLELDPCKAPCFPLWQLTFQFLLCWLEWQPFPHWTGDRNVQLCECDPVRTTSGVLGSAALDLHCWPGGLPIQCNINIWKHDHWSWVLSYLDAFMKSLLTND